MNIVSATIPDDCNPLDEMVAYWQMEEETSESEVGDSYGNHDGTWQGTRDQEPIRVNQAAKFSGDDKISIPDLDGALSLSGSSGFTIEFWFKKYFFPVPEPGYLLNKGNYLIEWTSSNDVKATVSTSEITSNTLSQNTEYHILLTWEPTGQNLSLWVNGDYQSSTTLNKPDPSSSQLEIGEDFVGLIDEVALYETYFTENQTKDHYALSSTGKDYCYPGGSNGSSSTRSDFTIEVCDLPGGGNLPVGACSRDGMYYCDEDQFLFYTLYDPYGCAFGRTYYNKGEPQCCPSGYLCDVDGDLTCGQRTEDCSNITNQNDCDNAGCFWFDEEGCIENPSEYSCSIYESNQSCIEDIWNLGQIGAGTEVCGTYFVVDDQGYVIPQDSCACDWVDDGYEHCVLGYDIKPDIYGGNASSFRCLKDFAVGPCVEGMQIFNWSVDQTNLTGNFSLYGIPPEVLEEAKCFDQDGLTRPCGEPIIKNPGFSLFSLFSSVSILALYYLFKEKRHKKRN